MAILKRNIYVVAGATSGIGKEIGSFIEGDYYPIGGRNIQSLGEIAITANKKGFFIPGNLFFPESSAYDFFINELGPKNYNGVVQLFSSVDMDPIPVEENGVVFDDYIDPRNGQKWDGSVSKEERKEIRIAMADEQINFWELFLESLLSRTSKETLIIIYANSVMAKFYENYSVKLYSEYGRMKNQVSKLIEAYTERLEAKNIYIKNILLGIIDTPMFTQRGELSAKRTKKLLSIVAPNFPIDGQVVTIKQPLDPVKVAEFLYKIANIYPKAIPNKINLFDVDHLDIEFLMRDFIHKKSRIVKKIMRQKIIEKNSKVILVDETIKCFLMKLREERLVEYYQENHKNTKVNVLKLKSHINKGKEIVETLAPKISADNFIDTCIRLEGNYP